MDAQENYAKYKGMTGEPKVADTPLERDTLRRFVQAIMDADPTYTDEAHAAGSKFQGLVAPPLYPVHAFRPQTGASDPLDSIIEDRDADGTYGNLGVTFGLPAVESPYKRLLNGGNEIEFYRCLRVGERVVAQPKYADLLLKAGKSGHLLLVVIETRFTTEAGDLLLVNKQTLIWR